MECDKHYYCCCRRPCSVFGLSLITVYCFGAEELWYRGVPTSGENTPVTGVCFSPLTAGGTPQLWSSPVCESMPGTPHTSSCCRTLLCFWFKPYDCVLFWCWWGRKHTPITEDTSSYLGLFGFMDLRPSGLNLTAYLHC